MSSYIFKKILSANYETCGNDLQYAIEYEDETNILYVFFQGSTSKEDWKNNFDFPVKPYSQGQRKLLYHGGYCKTWKSARKIVTGKVMSEARKHENCLVVFAGHSQGGCYALEAAEDYEFFMHDMPTVFTYGAPKLCYGKRTSDILREHLFIFQFVNTNDPVPYLPPFPGYCHADRLYKYKKAFNFWRFITGKDHTDYANCQTMIDSLQDMARIRR